MLVAEIINNVCEKNRVNCLEFRIKRPTKSKFSKNVVIFSDSSVITGTPGCPEVFADFAGGFDKNPIVNVESVLFFDRTITPHIYCNKKVLAEDIAKIRVDRGTDICGVLTTLIKYISVCKKNMAFVIIFNKCECLNSPAEIVDSLVQLHNVTRNKLVEFHCISIGEANDIFLLDKLTKISTGNYSIQRISSENDIRSAFSKLSTILPKYCSYSVIEETPEKRYIINTVITDDHIIGRLYGDISGDKSFKLITQTSAGRFSQRISPGENKNIDKFGTQQQYSVMLDYCFINLQILRSMIGNNREKSALESLLTVISQIREYYLRADILLNKLPLNIQKKYRYDHNFLLFLIDHQNEVIESALSGKMTIQMYGNMLQLLSAFRHNELRPGFMLMKQYYEDTQIRNDRTISDLKQKFPENHQYINQTKYIWDEFDSADFLRITAESDYIAAYSDRNDRSGDHPCDYSCEYSYGYSYDYSYISTEYFLNKYMNGFPQYCHPTGIILPLLTENADETRLIDKLREVYGFPDETAFMENISTQPFRILADIINKLFMDKSNKSKYVKLYNYALETCKIVYVFLSKNAEFYEKMRHYVAKYDHPGFVERVEISDNAVFCGKILCGILTGKIPEFEDEQKVTNLFLSMLCEEHRRNIPEEYKKYDPFAYIWDKMAINPEYFSDILKQYEDNLKKIAEKSSSNIFKRRFLAKIGENDCDEANPANSPDGYQNNSEQTIIDEIVTQHLPEVIKGFKFSQENDKSLFIDIDDKCRYVRSFFKLFTEKDLVQTEANSIVWLCMCLQNLIQREKAERIRAIKDNPFDISDDILTDYYVMKWSDDVLKQYTDFTGPGAYDRAIVWLRGLIRFLVHSHIEKEKKELYRKYIDVDNDNVNVIELFCNTGDPDIAAGILLNMKFGDGVSRLLEACGKKPDDISTTDPIPIFSEKLRMIMTGKYRNIDIIPDFSDFTSKSGGKWIPSKKIRNNLIRRNGEVVTKVIAEIAQ